MTYTGNVQVGGPADTRELRGLTVTKIAVGPYDNNAYLLRSAADGTKVLIDAASEPDRLLELTGTDLSAVITTHRHPDHWQGLAQVTKATGCTTYAGREDAEGIPVATSVLVDDGDTIEVGDIRLTAIHLVGHTPGSIALRYDDPAGPPHLFTGDCLFPGGVGNTDHDPARFSSLFHDVRTKLFGTLPDETWVYPGHGGDTTLGAERPHLDEWRERGW
ncbi:MAG TPA: MBL fold metallo-hydrolase [Streptosporangiaceae bacterium]|nr:MBL fold metallo-hydrolase [Streptosporangiaceae bacterium]